MGNPLRTLGALALLGGLASSASAQDCARIPTSAGSVDQAYASCARPSDAPAVASPSDLSFGHNASTSTFVNFAQNAPQVLLPVGPFTSPFFLGALDFEGNDLTTAYGLDTDNSVFQIDASNGSVTDLGNLTPLDGEQWTAITYDYVDDTFYALAAVCGGQTSLYEVSFSPLSRTRIGTDFTNETCGVTLASNPATGDLFGYGVVSDQLVRYNKGTGATTVVGPLGFSANFGQAADFDNQDGTLYAYAFDDIDFRAELLTINTSTGNATLVGTLGNPVNLDQIGAGASKTQVESETGPTIDATASTLTVPQGGSVTFNYTVTNPTQNAVTGDLFFRAQIGVNTVAQGEIINNGTLPAGQSFSGSFTQNVPQNAPATTYTYTLAIGVFPNTIVDSDVFTITVTPARVAGSTTTWATTDVTPWAESSVAAVSEAVVASPNPFAGETSLRFSLDEAADVRLAVYDLLGREVALLVDGAVEAGAHTATFEARDLAAGTYVYRLVVNDQVQTGRLTLAH